MYIYIMYMKNNIILFAVATLALNSCGIYKKYEPVATLPENLYREEIAPADTFSIGNISWRDLFTDPALQSLIERGLANNTDLRIAHLKVQEAEAALMTSRMYVAPSTHWRKRSTGQPPHAPIFIPRYVLAAARGGQTAQVVTS